MQVLSGNELHSRPIREIDIWTDGSSLPSNPGYMGLGMCARLREGENTTRTYESWAYAGYGTSNLAELLAVHFALSVLGPRERDGVTIHTDSFYVLSVVDGAWNAGKHAGLVRDLRVRGVRIEGLTTSLVKAHDGLRENERADILAYQGASTVVHFERIMPVYLWEESPAKEFEQKLVPIISLLQKERRERALNIHRRIERGWRPEGPDALDLSRFTRDVLYEIRNRVTSVS